MARKKRSPAKVIHFRSKQPPEVTNGSSAIEFNKRFYSVKQFANKYSVGERTVWRWIKDKGLKVIRVGGTVRISVEAEQDFINNNK